LLHRSRNYFSTSCFSYFLTCISASQNISSGILIDRRGITMTRRFTYLNLLAAFALAAQRFNIRLPEVILKPLRSLLIELVKGKAIDQSVKDWSSPLIAGREVMSDQSANAAKAQIGIENDALPMAINLPEVEYSLKHTMSSGESKGGLRCLLVTSALDVGGLDEVVAFLARRLPRYNIYTAVLHASAEGSVDGFPTGRLGQLLLEQGIETVELAAVAGERWLKTWRPDVISAHGAPPWVLDAATRLSIPYLDTLHGMHSHFGTDWTAEIERGRRLAGIVTVSDLNRRQYLNGNPTFPKERIVTIPNAVDDERRVLGDRNRTRTRLGIENEYLFVSLARHCLQKNTYGLVAGFGAVAAQHPEAHLLIAGHPSDEIYFSQVLRLRESLACRDRIHLRDHVSNPAELLAAADGFVLDSFFEGWSLASMEALYAGVPVVLSEVGGALEQVGDDKKRGYVIPNPLGNPLQVNWQTMRKARFAYQANQEALVAAMSSLITDRATWIDKRQWLISESATRFHPDVCLSSHARVLMAAVCGDPLQQYESVLYER
jgi:glycosyltransferase involved in cell wall biosynthesis